MRAASGARGVHESTTTVRSANAQGDAARAAVARAESYARRKAHACADAAQAALDVAGQNLACTKIVAPVAGTVSRLAVHAYPDRELQGQIAAISLATGARPPAPS